MISIRELFKGYNTKTKFERSIAWWIVACWSLAGGVLGLILYDLFFWNTYLFYVIILTGVYAVYKFSSYYEKYTWHIALTCTLFILLVGCPIYLLILLPFAMLFTFMTATVGIWYVITNG